MLNSLEEVLPDLARQRPQEPRTIHWSTIENRLGKLPSDYKELAEAYPSFVVDEFLSVSIPRTGREESFCDSLLEDLQDLAQLSELDESHGYNPYPPPRGLLPVATTFSGDILYWRTNDTNPDAWTIVVSTTNDDWWQYTGTLTEFLVDWLGGTMERIGLPSEVPRRNPPVRLGKG